MTDRTMMLWRSDDAPHVRILGSIHYLEEVVPDWVLEVHAGAHVVVFEADFTKAQEPESAPPTTAPDLALPALDPELWRIVEGLAPALGLSAQDVDNLRNQYPFAIAGGLVNAAFGKSGAHFELGPDAVLTDRTPHPFGLETFPEFYKLVYQETPLSEQLASLRFTIGQLDGLPERLQRASEHWRMGDPEAVLEALGFYRYFNDFPGLAAGLFGNRHALWLPRAEYFIQKSAEFGHRLLVVVGCAHLAGPQTFIADLQEHYGYEFYR